MKSRSILSGALLTAALTLLYDLPARAAGGGEQTPLHLGSGVSPTHAGGGSSTGSIVRTIVGLFIVIAVIYGVTWILRQVKGGRTRASGSGLTSVATLPLGSNRSLALVRVGRDLVLLGVAEGSITKIRSYDEAEALELGVQAVDQEPDPDPSGTLSTRVVDSLRRLTVRS